MTDAREAATEAIAFHTLSTADPSCCTCGTWLGPPDEGPIETRHAEHVADAVLAAVEPLIRCQVADEIEVDADAAQGHANSRDYQIAAWLRGDHR